jgi:apolipoprotein N-acyltransferase
MRSVLLTLLSAALYVLAFPPWDLHFLCWACLIPLLLVVRRVRPAQALGIGLLWGTAVIWGIGHWVPAALMNYWGQSLWFGVTFAMVGAILFVGTYGAGFAACASWLGARTSPACRTLLLSAVWVAWEVARGSLLTGDPWLLIGYAASSHPILIQVADLGGVFLVSFVIVVINAAATECLAADRRRGAAGLVALAPAAAVLAGTLVYGAWRLALPLPASPALNVSVIQGNNDPGRQWKAEHYGQGLEEYLRLSTQAAGERPAVIVWPESAVTFFLAHEPHYQTRIRRLLEAVGSDLLVGAPHHEDVDPARPAYFNSAFYMTSDGHITGRYDKVHLLPFGEYFPLRTIEFLRRRFERVRYFTPAQEARLLDTRLGKIAVAICFEAIFPDLVRRRMSSGAEILVNLSNDAWLGDNAGPRQHATMIAMRAVENRTWVVRATTTGISAVIDPFGRTVTQTQIGVPARLGATVVPLQVPTAYKRYGNVFANACVLVSALAFPFLVWWQRHRIP